MRKATLKINHQRKGQTILELSLVVFSLLGFFFLGLFAFSIFEVSQKQTLLTRAQAFIELGNYSTYGQAGHGKDDPKDTKSQVYFQLGKKSPGIFRVDFDKVETFKEAVEGELDLTAGAETEDVFWSKYRFPKRLTRLFGGENRGELDSVELETYLAIAHNRSIDLDKENSAKETGEYSTGVHFLKINEPLTQSIQKALSESYGAELPSLISNYDETLALLKELVKEDSSVHREAEALENDMNVWRAIAGQAQAALVALAIQTALSFGFEALGNLLGSGAAAAGSAAEKGANVAVSSGGNALTAFGQGATDLAKFFTTTSHVLSVGYSASGLMGKPIQGLNVASTVTGGVGSVFQGLAGLDGFNVDGGFSGGGLKSDFFNSTGSVFGGASRITSVVDADAAKALGIASQGFGLAGSVSGLGENWSTWSAEKGGVFKQSSALGQTISQGAGLLSHAAPGSTAVGAIGLVGSAFSTVGGAGTFAHEMAAGKYDGRAFDVMSQTGGLMAQTSGLAMNMMSLTGNNSAMEGLAIAAIAGGSLAAAGAAGNLVKGVIEDAPTWGQKISDGVDSVLSGEAFEGAFDGVRLASGGEGWDREAFHKNMDAISNAAQAINMGLSMASAVKAGAAGGAAVPGVPTDAAAAAQNLESAATQVAANGGATQTMENILNDIDPTQVIASTNMSGEEAENFQRDFLAVKRSMSEIKKSYKNKEIPDEKMLKKAQAAATRLQETLDKHSKSKDEDGKKNKPKKEKFDLADAAEENMNLHRYYQARYQQHFRIVGYTQTSENHLMGKTIIANGSEKRDFVRDYGKKVSNEIRSYRETNFKEDDPSALRLKRAEYHWRNLNFISPKEALDLLRAQYQNQKRGFEDLKTRFQNQLQVCGLDEAC